MGKRVKRLHWVRILAFALIALPSAIAASEPGTCGLADEACNAAPQDASPVDAGPLTAADQEQDAAPMADETLAALESLLADATALREAGEHARARELIAALIDRALIDLVDRNDESILAFIERCGAFAHDTDELRAAERARRWSLKLRSTLLPDEHADIQRARARHDLARTKYALGDLQGARALFEEVLAVYERTMPVEHPDILSARENLAATIASLGGLQEARALQEEVLAIRERTLPAEHPELQKAQGNLAVTIKRLGDLRGARALEEEVLAVFERTLPAEHPKLQAARQGLAVTMASLGDLHGARMLFEQVLAVSERTLPAEHPDLQLARGNLAVTIKWLGDLHGARALQEEVLAVRERTLPAEHTDLQLARGNLGSTMYMLGDLHGARALFEEVLAVFERTLPADHPELQTASKNLAATKAALGDLHGARALLEEVLAVRVSTLPAEHQDIQLAREGLAVIMYRLGDLHAAHALQREVMAVFERTLPAEHPDLLTARQNLAATMSSLGVLLGARALQEEVLAVRERALPTEHPDLQVSRQGLAVTLYLLGDLPGARALQEELLAVRERTLPANHPGILAARVNLAATIIHQTAAQHVEKMGGERAGRGKGGEEGGWPGAVDLVALVASEHVQAARVWISTASIRETEQRIGRLISGLLGLVLSSRDGYGVFDAGESLVAEAFILSETTRAPALASAGLVRAHIDLHERERLRQEISAASAELAKLARRGATREEYHQVRSRREAAERVLLAWAREQVVCGAFELGVGTLASVVNENTALVGFLRYPRFWLEETRPVEEGPAIRFKVRSRTSLGAFVLRAREGEPRLAFVDMGGVEDIADAVRSWRATFGIEAQDAGRPGAAMEAATTESVLVAGGDRVAMKLRQLVWDPLVEALGDAERVIVALDDVLHLIPLDALPMDGGQELVGERWRIETRLALWELLDRPTPHASGGGLVVLGGADFDAEPLIGGEEEEHEDGVASAPALADARPGTSATLLRGGPLEAGFDPLPHTEQEMRKIADLYAGVFGEGQPMRLLRGARASRGELEGAAPEARWLHLATHGWFAPDSVRSWADPQPEARMDGFALRMTAEETVRGMNPMLLCGLALAGSNLPGDFLGRVPGLITAEEIATLDLTNCELAVLSACDTNVGLIRAGQGVASLQKALHIAGARSVITSRWKVDDAATAKLFERFYIRLWHERMPKSDALWETKMELMREGYPVKDWAAWILTGDPN